MKYNNINIRLAVLSDASAMAEIHARSWEAAYKDIMPAKYIEKQSEKRPAQWRNILSQENKKQYIIEADGKPAGMVCVGEPHHEYTEIFNDDSCIDSSFCELHNIYLHPNYFRCGIGTRAMDFAINKGREANKSNIVLWVFAENIGSIRFYEVCGFSVDGAYMFYNCGKEMKAIRMRREI